MGRKKELIAEVFDSVSDGLKNLYASKIKPIEMTYKFGEFYSPYLLDADFEAKPMVLLLGQYSVGKTSFIKYLLGRDFPGAHIGPEPTTDRFIAVMHGNEDKQTPGNALAVSANMPFRGLELFGNGFLQKFMGSQCDSPLLHHVTLIDTPGVLSGEKQRIGRTYSFTDVCAWFANRADVILLLFDAHKLDISDEFKEAIDSLKGHDDKIRVVLNKADMVDPQKLLRIYGALMWSLGKVVKTPEGVRVYIGSFWEQPLKGSEWTKQLLEAEMRDLLTDLKHVPKNATIRKVNELVKRVRLAKAHAYIVGHLKQQMPGMLGNKAKAQAKLLASLEDHFLKVHRAQSLPVGDFPDVQKFRGIMEAHDLSKFPKLDTKALAAMEDVLTREIPKLLAQFPAEGTDQSAPMQAMQSALTHAVPAGNPAIGSSEPPPPQLTYQQEAPPPPQYQQPYQQQAPPAGPFAGAPAPPGGPFGTAPPPAAWGIPPADVQRYNEVFSSLGPSNGLVSGGAARPVLEQSGLPVASLRQALVSPAPSHPSNPSPSLLTCADLWTTPDPLRASQIWTLSDIDRDGYLDAEEFAVAMHLTRECAQGRPCPDTLPFDITPPSKRR